MTWMASVSAPKRTAAARGSRSAVSGRVSMTATHGYGSLCRPASGRGGSPPSSSVASRSSGAKWNRTRQRLNRLPPWSPSTQTLQRKPAPRSATEGLPGKTHHRTGPEVVAFQKPTRHTIPKVADPHWSAHPIDAFIKKTLDEKGLAPAPQADRNTLIRRATLDLTAFCQPHKRWKLLQMTLATRLRKTN